MPLSNVPTSDDRDRGLATIHAALDAGITLLDTADIYAPAWNAVGHNEKLVAEAVRTWTGDTTDVLITTKGGITRFEGEGWGRDGSVAGLRKSCEASLKALDASVIELYQHHRHDPDVPYLEQVRGLGALQRDGLVRRVGLSNVNSAELAVAIAELGGPDDGGIVSVQNEWSPRFRGDADVLAECTRLGITFLPWSPLGGATMAHEVGSRFADFGQVAQEVDASAQEVTLAWLLATTPVMIPIPGASRPDTVASIIRSLSVTLNPEQLARLDATEALGESMYPDDNPRAALPA